MTRMEKLKLKIEMMENESIKRYVKGTPEDLQEYKLELKELNENEWKKIEYKGRR